MGGLCSRNLVVDKAAAKGRVDHYGYEVSSSNKMRQSSLTTPPPVVQENMEKQQLQQPFPFREMKTGGYGGNPDPFYDGIPRYTGDLSQKSRSIRPTQAAVAKVSEVGSRLSRASTRGLGKAVDVLDTLGSSMTNLTPNSGFVSGAPTKGDEISILAFEVANTIVKGSNLMESLSEGRIRHLKEEVLCAEGVQNLVSKDMNELLRIVAADKREELKIFSGEVVRFGNRCKDPQWHDLDRYFEKNGREHAPQKQLKEEAESVMRQLMTLVQYTVELYHELHALDRFELDYQHQLHEQENSIASQKGDKLSFFKAELKGQKKQVKILKRKSLWSRSLEEVMEKLVDIVQFLHLEIHNAFGFDDDGKSVEGHTSANQKLGPAGLSLHYANIVIQIDTLVARSSAMPQNTRDTLYQSLPPDTKAALRSKLRFFSVNEEFTLTEIKAEMEKTLGWLVPIATNTAKAHHGFGWVGEWANTGSEVNQKPAGQADLIRIETLHHADKEKTEACILELVLWLHHLVGRVSSTATGCGLRPPMKSPTLPPQQKTNQQGKQEGNNSQSAVLPIEDQEMRPGLN